LDLDEIICLNDVDLSVLKRYFSVEHKMSFSKLNGQVYANIRGFIFAFPFPHGIVQLDQTFFSGCFDSFDVSDGTVVDIGAFIGDTAVYFAAKGARRVIAYEPAPSLFEFAAQNIKSNKVDHIVDLRNEAVDNAGGQTTLYFARKHQSCSSTCFAPAHAATFKVKAVAFSNIIEEFGDVDLLKLNCEGAEHDILRQAYSQGLMRRISHVIVEIHGRPGNLLEILKSSGFKIVEKTSLAENVKIVSAKNERHVSN
jgi:FkbM family methyltransferase